jgi:hypothetical protein
MLREELERWYHGVHIGVKNKSKDEGASAGASASGVGPSNDKKIKKPRAPQGPFTTTMTYMKFAFVLLDGSVTEFTGSVPVRMKITQTKSYYEIMGKSLTYTGDYYINFFEKTIKEFTKHSYANVFIYQKNKNPEQGRVNSFIQYETIARYIIVDEPVQEQNNEAFFRKYFNLIRKQKKEKKVFLEPETVAFLVNALSESTPPNRSHQGNVEDDIVANFLQPSSSAHGGNNPSSPPSERNPSLDTGGNNPSSATGGTSAPGESNQNQINRTQSNKSDEDVQENPPLSEDEEDEEDVEMEDEEDTLNLNVVDDGNTNFLQVDSYVNTFEREKVEREEDDIESEREKEPELDLVLPPIEEYLPKPDAMFKRWTSDFLLTPFEEKLVWAHMVVDASKIQINSFLVFNNIKIGPNERISMYDEAKRLGTHNNHPLLYSTLSSEYNFQVDVWKLFDDVHTKLQYRYSNYDMLLGFMSYDFVSDVFMFMFLCNDQYVVSCVEYKVSKTLASPIRNAIDCIWDDYNDAKKFIVDHSSKFVQVIVGHLNGPFQRHRSITLEYEPVTYKEMNWTLETFGRIRLVKYTRRVVKNMLTEHIVNDFNPILKNVKRDPETYGLEKMYYMAYDPIKKLHCCMQVYPLIISPLLMYFRILFGKNTFVRFVAFDYDGDYFIVMLEGEKQTIFLHFELSYKALTIIRKFTYHYSIHSNAIEEIINSHKIILYNENFALDWNTIVFEETWYPFLYGADGVKKLKRSLISIDKAYVHTGERLADVIRRFPLKRKKETYMYTCFDSGIFIIASRILGRETFSPQQKMMIDDPKSYIYYATYDGAFFKILHREKLYKAVEPGVVDPFIQFCAKKLQVIKG